MPSIPEAEVIPKKSLAVKGLVPFLFRWRNETVFSFRHQDLEPGPLPVHPGLPNREPGDGEDLPGEEQPETGVLPESFLEDPLLVPLVDPDPVILVHESDGIGAVRQGKERDLPDPLPVAAGVVE